MIPWLKRSAPVIVVASGCGIFLSQSSASTTVKVVICLVCAAGLLIWASVRNLRLHTTVNRLAALGLPEAMLKVVEAELATSKSAQVQVPFSVYKATALAMQGKWAQALELLERVQPKRVVGAPGRTWRFLHANQQFTCLAFLGRVDEAEAVLKDELEPVAIAVRSPGTQVIIDEARAKLAFFKDRHEDSKKGFETLLADTRLMPSSKAMYHYFLARIADARGQEKRATEHRAQATELAPHTIMGGWRPERGGESLTDSQSADNQR